jgi:hypothetical protein
MGIRLTVIPAPCLCFPEVRLLLSIAFLPPAINHIIPVKYKAILMPISGTLKKRKNNRC